MRSGSPPRRGARFTHKSCVLGLASAMLAVLMSSAPAEAGDGPALVAPDRLSSGHLDAKLLSAMRFQESLQPLVTELYDVATQVPGSGFVSIAFAADGLILHWKGNVPASVLAVVRAARPDGVVRVRSARFSMAELDGAIARIESAARKAGAVADIQSIGARGDGSGIVVERMPADTFRRVQARGARLGRASVVRAEDAVDAARVTTPVEIRTAGELAVAQSRIDDVSPFNGGVRFRNFDAHQECTTGFGVVRGGQTYLLSAAHCASYPDSLYDGEIGQPSFSPMNTVYQEDWDKDIMLINARGFYRMFDGSPTTSNYKLVRGWGYRATGELLCHSGATSGTVCGLRTTDIVNGSYRVTDSDGDTFYVHGMNTAVQVNGMTAARGGDSGGPVFSLLGSGVRAKGVVSGSSGSTLIFQDWGEVIRVFNAYPVLAP